MIESKAMSTFDFFYFKIFFDRPLPSSGIIAYYNFQWPLRHMTLLFAWRVHCPNYITILIYYIFSSSIQYDRSCQWRSCKSSPWVKKATLDGKLFREPSATLSNQHFACLLLRHDQYRHCFVFYVKISWLQLTWWLQSAKHALRNATNKRPL